MAEQKVCGVESLHAEIEHVTQGAESLKAKLAQKVCGVESLHAQIHDVANGAEKLKRGLEASGKK